MIDYKLKTGITLMTSKIHLTKNHNHTMVYIYCHYSAINIIANYITLAVSLIDNIHDGSNHVLDKKIIYTFN